MQYLCVKQLTAGGRTFHPGNMIPDGVILPERSSKLIRNGYISRVNEEPDKNHDEIYTKEQVEKILEEAIEEAVNNTIAEMDQKQAELQEELQRVSVEQKELQQAAAELKEAEAGAYVENVVIDIIMNSDGETEQHMAVPAKPEEIQQVFSIMQLNAENGSKAVADVKSENVLILLHAADSRKTIKEAAKKQADNLFSTNRDSDAPRSGNASTDTIIKGDDT